MYAFEKRRVVYNEEIRQFPLHFPGNFFGRAIIGWGAIKMAGEACKQAGIENALLVSTGLKGTGILDEVQAICSHAGVNTTLFKVGQTNPRIKDAEEGVKAYKEAEADGIITVGGGTSHDCGKLIRGRMANQDKDWSEMTAVIDPHFTQTFVKLNPVTIPQVSVNTTAGTGAEISGMAIVNDMDKHWKVCVLVPNNTPSVGITDPAVIRCLPEHLAAATGIDAFVHALEGFVSRLGNQISKGVAWRCAKLVWENLPEFTYNRWNDKACESMCWAALLGGMSFALGGGTGQIHGLAHQLSALDQNLQHGLTNAIMMIPVTKLNFIGAPESYADFGKYCLEIDTKKMTRFEAAEAAVERMEYLRNAVGITEEKIKLSSYDITEKDCEDMTKYSINSLCYEGNVRDWTEEDSLNVYKGLL